MAALRVLVADDHEIVRKGVCALITSHPGWEVCGEAANGRKAVAATLRLSMPELHGLAATRQILEAAPNTAVLVFGRPAHADTY